MSPIQSSLIKGFAIAALLLVGAKAVHAQSFEPNGAPYACTWRLSTGGTGVSLVTFTFTSTVNGIRKGTVRNLYADGSQIVRGIDFFPDIHTGNYVFRQDNGVTCQVQLFSSNREVVFTDCTNGVLQNCRQWQ